MTSKKFNLIILGSAGAGKGTQARLLAEKYKMKVIEMGELVRMAAKQKNEKGRLIAWMHKAGMHFPDNFIEELFDQKIKKTDLSRRLLIDGYPRTAGQAWDLERILKKYYSSRPHLALWIKINDQEAIQRLLNRAICSKCGQIFLKRNIKKCPVCGGQVKVRDYDQDKKSIKKRLTWFHQHVIPAIEFYRRRKNLIIINGEQKPEKVFQEIIRKIEKKL